MSLQIFNAQIYMRERERENCPTLGINISMRKAVEAAAMLKQNRAAFTLIKEPRAKVVKIMSTTQTLVTYIIAVTCLASFNTFTFTFLVWNARNIPMTCNRNR